MYTQSMLYADKATMGRFKTLTELTGSEPETVLDSEIFQTHELASHSIGVEGRGN